MPFIIFGKRGAMSARALLSAHDLKIHFPLTPRWPWQTKPILRAVDGVSIALYPGQTLGLVGESGCGKSTLARGLTGLAPITAGQIQLAGQDITRARSQDWQSLRRQVQMIFQDPLASLDPRMTVAQIVAEPLRYLYPQLSARQRRQQVLAMLERVGLTATQANRYPHEFSGGQCQRIGIARALIVQPRVLICDEPVSALDVSIQARIMALLVELQRQTQVAILFIAHDLAVVRQISDAVQVMYLGQTMEKARAEALFAQPQHPYTQALISAAPRPDLAAERQRRRIRLAGDLPSPVAPPPGCVFHTRCPWARPDCRQLSPSLRPVAASQTACHYAEKIARSDGVAAASDRASAGSVTGVEQ